MGSFEPPSFYVEPLVCITQANLGNAKHFQKTLYSPLFSTCRKPKEDFVALTASLHVLNATIAL